MAEIRTVGVVGLGQMGAGIAQVAATAGFKTVVWDERSAGLEKGLSGIAHNLKKLESKGKISADQNAEISSRIKRAEQLQDFSGCDLVIEAIIEKLETKAELFCRLSPVLGENAILASNTSSISMSKMAALSGRADRFLGLHFMNPVPVMQLVEVIRALQTSADTFQAGMAFVEKLGKKAVVAIDSPGFIVNRVLVPMINEAIFLLQEGVKAEDIDSAMKLGTNQPMGPLELADFVGLDTLLFILQVLQRELGEDKYRPCPLLTKYVEAGWYGRKSGRGFYTY